MENRLRRVLLSVVIIAVSSLMVSVARSQASLSAVPVDTAAPLASAQTQSDFDLMRKALEEAHSGLYRYASKPEMDRVFDTQRAKLSRAMSSAEFLTVLAETIAQIKCGHSGVRQDEELQKELVAARKFPLQVRLEGPRMIVLFNDTANDQTIRPGMEILEINGRKSDDIVKAILPRLSRDGDIETGRRMSLQQSFPQLFWLSGDRSSEFTIKAQEGNGKVVSAKLPGVTDDERKNNSNGVNADLKANLAKLKWSQGNLSLRFLKDPDIAQIRIDGFGGNDYPKWMEDTFRTLKEKGTKSLIIDLRGNGGGADMYGAMLVSYLTDKPFRYFDHINVKTINPSFVEYSDWRRDREPRLRELMKPNPAGGFLVPIEIHPGVAEQPAGKYPFLGKVFVLIDGGTFSTAADFCAVTHHLKRATFIGEETGGGYYGNNSGMQTVLTLPNSKVRVRIPMYEYWNAVPGYDGTRRGTRPDRVIETKVGNLLKGIDEQLNVALKMAE
ncbi:MAG TPA: S41 family peptidase [Blastocatellia bacterium]|nr:S41 family peptidase [Blastocatellia bacterium]